MKRFLNDVLLPHALLTIGAAVAALALEEFLVPFQILDGGVVGVSMIVSQLSGLPLGLFIVVLNIPFLLVGLKRLGRTFLVRALYAMLVFSVLLEVFKPLPPLTEQELLVVVFGGVLLGLGVGLILRSGGCLDGTEIVAMLLSQRVPFSTGQIVLGFNIIIYAAAGLLFGLDRALYSLLTYFITSKIIDMVQNGMEQGKAVTIITNEGRQAARPHLHAARGPRAHQRGEGGALLRRHAHRDLHRQADHPCHGRHGFRHHLRCLRDPRSAHQAAQARSVRRGHRVIRTPRRSRRLTALSLT